MASVQFSGWPFSRGWTKQYPQDAKKAALKCSDKIGKPVSIDQMRTAAKKWSEEKSENQGSKRPKHEFYIGINGNQGVTGSKENVLNEVV